MSSLSGANECEKRNSTTKNTKSTKKKSKPCERLQTFAMVGKENS